MSSSTGIVPGSFRDPSGFLFRDSGVLYRQVNRAYREHYEALMGSGLYDDLIGAGLLIPHEETDLEGHRPDESLAVIKPEAVPFVSYPYEWCFSQLKDAALATLETQRRALTFGMSLKDASAYNIQFLRGRPVMIDTLSFERYEEGRPWVAYSQFCRHFLAPLLLMSYKDVRLGQLSRVHVDGIPLDLAASLLPFRTRFKLSSLMHIHLHARSDRRYATRQVDPECLRGVSLRSFQGLVDNLRSAVNRLRWNPGGTEWADYYGETNYSDAAFEHKKRVVAGFLERLGPKSAWDVGANTGVFSRLAAESGALTISMDVDPACVEKNYLGCSRDGVEDVLPLLVDLFNPSPAIGWELNERMSILERGPADTVLALAFVHHMVISNNVPLERVAQFFGDLCDHLIIEFVPKSDSQVQWMLATREDIFTDYDRAGFEEAFGARFDFLDSADIESSDRTVYLMSGRQAACR